MENMIFPRSICSGIVQWAMSEQIQKGIRILRAFLYFTMGHGMIKKASDALICSQIVDRRRKEEG